MASKRRLQLSTVVILINGNDQNFENDGVMPKLRGSKKILQTFRPRKISLIQANIHFDRILPELFSRWEGFFENYRLIKDQFHKQMHHF